MPTFQNTSLFHLHRRVGASYRNFEVLEKVRIVFAATELYSILLRHSLFSSLKIDVFGWSDTPIFVFQHCMACVCHRYWHHCVKRTPVTTPPPPQTPFLPVVSSHKISNLYFPQIFSLVFSLQVSLLFPLTSHLEKILSAITYQDVLEDWLMWEKTSPDN
jgi:hypothetical protein